jgi:hypothetical protein
MRARAHWIWLRQTSIGWWWTDDGDRSLAISGWCCIKHRSNRALGAHDDMHLALLFWLGLAAAAAAQTTCENAGTPRADGTCACPPGFGGATCSAPACGGNLFQGSQRPVSQNASTGGLSFAGCACEDGWGGAGCNRKCGPLGEARADARQSVARKPCARPRSPPREEHPTRGRSPLRSALDRSATRRSHATPSLASMPPNK